MVATYGQTGSGKTFTMLNLDPANIGIMFLSVKEIIELNNVIKKCYQTSWREIKARKLCEIILEFIGESARNMLVICASKKPDNIKEL